MMLLCLWVENMFDLRMCISGALFQQFNSSTSYCIAVGKSAKRAITTLTLEDASTHVWLWRLTMANSLV